MSAQVDFWAPQNLDSSLPVYKAIIKAIEEDVQTGRLKAGSKLPPQRQLAEVIGIDFTTVSRAYSEGKKRGLLVARVGQGTFVSPSLSQVQSRQNSLVDMGMNIPPVPADPILIQRMKAQMADTIQNLEQSDLFAYQDFFGSPRDREIAASWVANQFASVNADQLLICPGTQSALFALLSSLVGTGQIVVSENLTYPGFKSVTQRLGLQHVGLEVDEDGLNPQAFELACQQYDVAVLYCTATQHNPTTLTWSGERRQEIAGIAKKYNVQIIEDDAYGAISPGAPPPLSQYAPELSFYLGGLAKCLSSALRVTFVCCPDRASVKPISAALRETAMMVSPLTKAMALDLISSGTAKMMAEGIVEEAKRRQALAREILKDQFFNADPNGFHIWLALPKMWLAHDFISQMSQHGVRLVHGDVFCVGRETPKAVRICLGAPHSFEKTREVLEAISSVLKADDNFANAIV